VCQPAVGAKGRAGNGSQHVPDDAVRSTPYA
jgi:hypothetical protein